MYESIIARQLVLISALFPLTARITLSSWLRYSRGWLVRDGYTSQLATLLVDRGMGECLIGGQLEGERGQSEGERVSHWRTV